MCGIFGAQYNEEHAPDIIHRSIIASFLANETETRGRHASGLAWFDKVTQEVLFQKETGPYTTSSLLPITCMELSYIAHARYATVGANTQDNAHPWNIGSLVGAHNGGIFNHMDIAVLYPERKYQVDSMHLIDHIASSIDTEELEGYGTVEWFDVRDPNAIFICAMRRGDLEVEILGDEQGVIWASTRTAIAVALRAAGLYAKSRAFNVKEGVVYRIHEGKIAETERKIALSERKIIATASVHEYNAPTLYGAPYPDSQYKTPWSQRFETGAPDYTKAGYLNEIKPKKPKKRKIISPLALLKNVKPETEYERACRQYNEDMDRMQRSQVKPVKRSPLQVRFDKLLLRTEKHVDHCQCCECREVFKLYTMQEINK